MYVKKIIYTVVIITHILLIPHQGLSAFNTINKTSEDSIVINQLDSNGKKTGLWITVESRLKSEIYYKHGFKNGIYKVYHQNGELFAIGEYINDFFFW
jgi:antitoxin component YwqK of YwqJK toxin-antitoxin module